MRKKQPIGLCPHCLKVRYLQRHHIYPKRFFKKNNTTNLLYLCDNCHKEIEEILPLYRKLTKEEYLDIHKKWLRGEEVIVYPLETKKKKRRFEKYWQEHGRKQFLREGVI